LRLTTGRYLGGMRDDRISGPGGVRMRDSDTPARLV